jgi:hypothetical protein
VPNGGGTRREFPHNLLSAGQEPWNKWCEVQSDLARITVKLNRTLKVHGFGFKSANDEPKRDPDQVDIRYLDDKNVMVHFVTYKLDFEQKRWHTLEFHQISLDAKTFIFDFKNNVKEIQLGEIIFFGEN